MQSTTARLNSFLRQTIITYMLLSRLRKQQPPPPRVGGPEYNWKYTVICWVLYYKIIIKTNEKLYIRKINSCDIYYKYILWLQYMLNMIFFKYVSILLIHRRKFQLYNLKIISFKWLAVSSTITYFSLQKPMRQINGREESDGCDRENCQSAVTQKNSCHTSPHVTSA